jgi:arylsulfatase A-like enzyme
MITIKQMEKYVMNKQPNIVFVFADQMGAYATGYAGDSNVQTPFLDKLAGESVNFRNATSTCPICTPFRACLLSGQYPLTHGLFMNDLCMPDNGHSLGQELKMAGYDTAWIGKWHLDGHGRTNPIQKARRQGFDYWKVLECTHDYNNSQYYAGDDETPRFWDGYDAYAQTDDAADYIENHANTEKPFALFLSFGTPHDPYDSAPEELKALYPEDELVMRGNVPEYRYDHAKKQLSGYYAHITAIDKCLEQLDEALNKNGITNNTILVFTSDHGDCIESHWHCNTPERGMRKQTPYNEAVMVPFLLRYPNKYDAKEITTPIGSPDIMPTILEICGIEIPQTVEGISLKKTIDLDVTPERQGVLIANYHPFADWRTERGGKAYRGVRTERYTFVRDLNGPWLLFDNQEDPFQLTNLVNKSATKELQEQLDNELACILESQEDNFETPEMLRKRWGYKIDDMEAIPF